MSDVKFRSAAPVYIVEDVERAVEWYVQKLGFTAEFINCSEDEPAVYAVLMRDDLEIHLCLDIEGTYVRPSPPILALAKITISNLDEYHELLVANAVKIVAPPAEQFWGLEFMAEDPDGNVLWFVDSGE